jgi:type I restriction enzyme S subunit
MMDGYKETALGLIPEDWDVVKLGEVSSHIKDGTHATHKNVNDGIPLLSAKDIRNGKIKLSDDCRRISINDFNSIHKNFKLKNGDILLTVVGSIGRVSVISNYNDNYTFQRSVAYIRLKKIAFPDFFNQYFQTYSFNQQLLLKSNASAQAGVYLGELNKIKVSLPSLPEQQKIASILSTVDEKLDVIDAQIKETETLKKGLMQQLLTRGIGHSEFKDSPLGQIPESWEVVKIDEIADICTGGRDTQDRIENGNYPFYVRSNTVERIDTYSFDGEAVLTSGDGVGVGKIYHYLNEKFDYHQRVYNIHNFTDKIIGKFFYYYFSHNFYSRVMRLSAKNSVDSVRRNMITDMLCPLPSIVEQQKIASILSTADEKLEVQRDKRAEFEQLKKGLMQQLLTGKIRVKTDK